MLKADTIPDSSCLEMSVCTSICAFADLWAMLFAQDVRRK